MICDLPDDIPRGKRMRAERTDIQRLFPTKRRRIGIRAPVPQILKDGIKEAGREVAVGLVKAELRDCLKNAAFQGMERSFSTPEKQARMKSELDKSKALPALLQDYLSVIDNAPSVVQILMLLGQKASSVYCS